MPVPFSLDVYRDDLARVVQSVFETMIDLQVAVCETPWTHSHDAVTAAVHFAGDWRGAALVECDARQACQFATRLMGIPLPAAIDDDVRDAMGELANMVAGNLKSVLPRGVGLSMPSVVEGSAYTLRVCGAKAVERIAFSSPLGIFRITLVEMLQSA
jgi:chemotaxis protein CheX